MLIREIAPEDAEKFLQLCTQLDHETAFMLLEPGERKQDIDTQRCRLEEIVQSNHEMIFVAEDENRLVGYLAASGGTFQRNRHSTYLVIGILQEYTGKGVGSALFQAMEAWAQQKQLHRLELTVMVHNTAAIRLYQKRGFVIEGTKKHSLQVNKQYIDEYYMAKLLE